MLARVAWLTKQLEMVSSYFLLSLLTIFSAYVAYVSDLLCTIF